MRPATVLPSNTTAMLAPNRRAMSSLASMHRSRCSSRSSFGQAELGDVVPVDQHDDAGDSHQELGRLGGRPVQAPGQRHRLAARAALALAGAPGRSGRGRCCRAPTTRAGPPAVRARAPSCGPAAPAWPDRRPPCVAPASTAWAPVSGAGSVGPGGPLGQDRVAHPLGIVRPLGRRRGVGSLRLEPGLRRWPGDRSPGAARPDGPRPRPATRRARAADDRPRPRTRPAASRPVRARCAATPVRRRRAVWPARRPRGDARLGAVRVFASSCTASDCDTIERVQLGEPPVGPRQPQHAGVVEQLGHRRLGQQAHERRITLDRAAHVAQRLRRQLGELQERLQLGREGQRRAHLGAGRGDADGELEGAGDDAIGDLVAVGHAFKCTCRRSRRPRGRCAAPWCDRRSGSDDATVWASSTAHIAATVGPLPDSHAAHAPAACAASMAARLGSACSSRSG